MLLTHLWIGTTRFFRQDTYFESGIYIVQWQVAWLITEELQQNGVSEGRHLFDMAEFMAKSEL